MLSQQLPQRSGTPLVSELVSLADLSECCFKPVLSAAESCSAESPLGTADSAMRRPKHRLGFLGTSCQSASVLPAYQEFQTLVQVWRAGHPGPVLL